MAGQKLLLVLTILISTCIFALCWGFMIVIWRQTYVILPDFVVDLIIGYPTELTLVSTVISTILSVITTFLLSFAVKKAINHYITRPISLVELHTAIALTKPQPLLRWDHYKLSIFTLIFVCLVALLNSSWTTLLLPTLLSWPVPINGTDLDLGSSAFNLKLGNDTNEFGDYTKGWDLLVIMASMSGTLATASAVAGGDKSVFAFNGVLYTESSSGILPAVEGYAGTTLPPGEYIGLEYYGGKVAVNTSPANPSLVKGRYGLARNYTVIQQGLSATITCSDLDTNEYSLSFTPFNTSNTTWWQGTGYCSSLGSNTNYWSTENNIDEMSFLGILLCPIPATIASANVTSFDIVLQGMGQYNFLAQTVCTVAPYVALFDVTYNQGMISVGQQPYLPTQQLQTNMNRLASSSQTTATNPLGQLLQLSEINTTTTVHETLQNYFRGVVEFSATYLRSAYSAEGANMSSTMQDLYSNNTAFTSLNGTMFVTTYGWYRGRPTYIYVLIVFTVIWVVTVSAAVYSLIQDCIHPRTGPIFDASNPVHLMMASSAGGLEALARFEDNGALENEHARVRLLDGRGVTVAPDDAVGEKASAPPTRPTMPRFEIVP
ncbi:hypothetical protein DFJ58DRAFT_748255 [Suillus subalutaceus]|uniref:uncharacterized protein n=1 Tax=Suillus subalutaceus TaxID=48586 RepID=UPI001B874C41|nr:uncharacterized protein DFJ58DRAFT_748255 [Suillus subalutaceus]KAG1842187.1 hypothetical protein DFJ58DRAFT_748255 [Suillus subalutaceus]